MKIMFLTENIHCGGLDTFLISLVNYWPYPEDNLAIVCNPSHPGIAVIQAKLTRPCQILRHDISTYSDLVLRTKKYPVLHYMRRLLSPLIRYPYFFYYLFSLRSIFRQNPVDRLIVVNGGHPGGDTCRAATITWRYFANHKPRAIYNFHNLATTPRWFEKIPEKFIDAWLVRCSRALIGVSRVCAESLPKRLGNKSMVNVTWIYNGISPPRPPVTSAQSASLREELGIPLDAHICLMLATYEPRKGHDFLLQAFQKVILNVPNTYLVICGYGYSEEVERVKNLVKKYNLSEKVRLQGFRRDVDTLLTQSDLLLIASQAFESFGLTSVEAMANRIPVVTTRVGGIPEVVADGQGGFCVDPNDIDGYATRIIEFLRNPFLREEQASKGYQRYRAFFSVERMANEYATRIRAAS